MSSEGIIKIELCSALMRQSLGFKTWMGLLKLPLSPECDFMPV